MAPSKKSGAGMIKATYRSKFTIGMAWVYAPLLLGTAVLHVSTSRAADLDALALLAAASLGLTGLLFVWILVKRRVPVVAISDQTLEFAPTFPFQRPRSLFIDEISGVALEGRTIVIDTRAGTVKFLQLALAGDELRPILATIQRRIEERKTLGGE